MLSTIAELFFEFLKIGFFAVGGGPATLPFLMDLTKEKTWYTMQQLTDMIAISESTPGPLGLNMATYAGFQALGWCGGFVATLGLVIPSILIIILIAKFLENFSQNKYVKAAFRGIRPAVTGLIGAAVFRLCQVSLFTQTEAGYQPRIYCILLAVAVFGLLQIKEMPKFHPVVWFLGGAIIGILFRF